MGAQARRTVSARGATVRLVAHKYTGPPERKRIGRGGLHDAGEQPDLVDRRGASPSVSWWGPAPEVSYAALRRGPQRQPPGWYNRDMRYYGAVIRPPSEASSLIVQVTYGCSNASCDFCGTYLGKPFAVRPPDEVERDIVDLPLAVKERVRRVFLADGDALALSRHRLEHILALLRRELPALERVSSYANARNLLTKAVDDLDAIRAAGLELLYLGLESGDDETLAAIHKGVTVAEQIEGCARATAAGFELSITAILGLAGRERSLAHARATGAALSAIDPPYIGVLSLMVEPGTRIAARVAAGEFVVPDAFAMVRELREMVAATDVTDALFRSNHASNYLPMGGRLPHDKGTMLAALDTVLATPDEAHLKPEEWRLL